MGRWSRGRDISPPLLSSGTSHHETLKIGRPPYSVKFGGSSPCGAPSLTPRTVDGALKGTLKFTMPDANRCSTIFSGSPLVPVVASKFKMTWVNPHGVPTLWKQPSPFSVTGASNMTSLTITGGALTGSFSSYPTPTATLSDTTWTAALINGACSSGGLSSLTLALSSGTW